MKNSHKLVSLALTPFLVLCCYSQVLTSPGTENNVDLDAQVVGSLNDAYRLDFLPLTPCGTERFKSGVIEFAETDGTFSLTLFSEGDPDGTSYSDCPYETYGGYHSTLLVGYSPPGLVGAGFTLTGITLGNRFLVGFLQFRLVTLPPVECSYLFLGRDNQQSVIITDAPPESIQLDPFGLEGIKIAGDNITLTVTYSGGCMEHEFSLYMSPATFLESYPVQANLYLRHNGNGDACEALINKKVSFNLRPVAELYKSLYGQYDEMIINVADYKSTNTISARYFPEEKEGL